MPLLPETRFLHINAWGLAEIYKEEEVNVTPAIV